MIVACTTERAEHLLATADLRCPTCSSGQLSAWGYGRRRTVRDLAMLALGGHRPALPGRKTTHT